MAITITALNVTEDYAALTVLTQAQLNTAVADTEDYCNTQLRLNIVQMAKDIFDNATYTLNDDGVATFATPIIDLVASLADNETVTGQWTFSGATTFSSTITGGASTVVTVSGQPRVKAYLTTANQSIGNTTNTAISMAAETYDVGTLHDNATNPSRITIAAGNTGVYAFNAQAVFAASNAGYRVLMLYKNGSKVCETKNFGPHATEETTLNLSFQDVTTTNDYYEMYVYQSSGGALDVVHTVTFMSAMKVW